MSDFDRAVTSVIRAVAQAAQNFEAAETLKFAQAYRTLVPFGPVEGITREELRDILVGLRVVVAPNVGPALRLRRLEAAVVEPARVDGDAAGDCFGVCAGHESARRS